MLHCNLCYDYHFPDVGTIRVCHFLINLRDGRDFCAQVFTSIVQRSKTIPSLGGKAQEDEDVGLVFLSRGTRPDRSTLALWRR